MYLSRSLDLQSFLVPWEVDLEEQQHLSALTMYITIKSNTKAVKTQPTTTAIRDSCETCSVVNRKSRSLIWATISYTMQVKSGSHFKGILRAFQE